MLTTAARRKAGRALLLGLVTFAVGTMVLPHVASSVANYSLERRESIELRNGLAREVEITAADLELSLAVFSGNLTPSGQVLSRCFRGGLPPLASRDRNEICDDAAIAEIREEQEQLLAFRASLTDATAIGRRLADGLEDDEVADLWAAVVSGFDDLRHLSLSTTCNDDLVQAVERLRRPTDGSAASDRRAVIDAPLTDADLDLSQVETGSGVVVADILIGPATPEGARCDERDPLFIAAHQRVRAMFVDEAGTTATKIREARASNLDDRPSDLLGRLLNPFYVSALVVAFVAWWWSQFLRQDPERPLKVQIVSESDDDVSVSTEDGTGLSDID